MTLPGFFFDALRFFDGFLDIFNNFATTLFGRKKIQKNGRLNFTSKGS
jgi:hypothetical protein